MFRFLPIAALLGLYALPVVAQTSQISGTVRTHAGAGPLAGARVDIWRLSAPFNSELVASGISAADGGYSLGVAGGCPLSCSIAVSVPGRIVLPASRSLTLAAGAASTDQDFSASIPAAIRVRVRDMQTQQTLSTARLQLFAGGGDTLALPQPDGSQLFASVLPGEAQVCVIDHLDNYINECQGGQVLPWSQSVAGLTPLSLAEGQSIETVIELDVGAHLRGVLTDRHRNAPIANTRMRIAVLQFSGNPAFTVDPITDQDGMYLLRGLRAGAFRLEAGTAPGSRYYTAMRYPGIDCLEGFCIGEAGSYFVANDTAIIDDAGFDLFPGSVVRGRVTDAAGGSGIGGVEVIAFAQQFFVGAVETTRSTTAIDGRFELANIPPQSDHRLGTANGLGYANRAWPNTACTAPCSNGQNIMFEPGIDPGVWNLALPAARAIAGQLDLGSANGSAVTASVSIYRDTGGGLQTIWSGPIRPDRSFVGPGLDAGTYFAAARISAPESQCQVFQGQACAAADPPIVIGQATPIVLPAATGIYPGTDFAFTIDRVFTSGFE